MQGDFRFLTGMAALFIGFPIYFLPSYIAGKKAHPKRRKILLINILFGWTGIVWAILLIWAAAKCTDHTR